MCLCLCLCADNLPDAAELAEERGETGRLGTVTVGFGHQAVLGVAGEGVCTKLVVFVCLGTTVQWWALAACRGVKLILQRVYLVRHAATPCADTPNSSVLCC